MCCCFASLFVITRVLLPLSFMCFEFCSFALLFSLHSSPTLSVSFSLPVHLHKGVGVLRLYPVLSCPLWPCNHHTQQDKDIFKAPPHLGAPFPLFDTVQVRKPRSQKMAIICPEKWMSLASVPMRVFRPAGRHQYRITYNCCCCCNSKVIL